MIRKVLPFASNYLRQSNLKKSVSKFAKTSLFSARFNSILLSNPKYLTKISIAKAFTSLSTISSFKFSTGNAGLNLNNTPQGSNVILIYQFELNL